MKDSVDLSAEELLTKIAFGPTVVLDSVRLDYPKQQILVQGRVEQLRPFYKDNKLVALYGEIADETAEIGFRLNPTPKLQSEGQYIKIIGKLHYQQNKYYKGFRIDGDMAEEYFVDKMPVKPVFEILENVSKKSLRIFLQEFSLDQLVLMTTNTGFADVISNIPIPGIEKSIRRKVIKITDKNAILSELKSIKEDDSIKGIGVIRGGGKQDDGLRLWDDVEVVKCFIDCGKWFYPAIAHSNQTFLIDKYAMESFPTPSSFGVAIYNALMEISEQEQLVENNESLNNKVADLDKKLNQAAFEFSQRLQSLTDQHQAQTNRYKLWIKRLTIGMAVLLAIFMLTVYFYNTHNEPRKMRSTEPRSLR